MINLAAASSVGKEPRVLIDLWITRFRHSMALVVYMISRIAGSKAKKRDHLPPGGGAGGVFPSQFFLAGIEFGLSHLGVAVNLAQVRGHGLTVPQGAKVQGMAYQLHDAGLDHRLGKGRRDRLWKVLQPVHNGDQNVLKPAGFISLIT